MIGPNDTENEVRHLEGFFSNQQFMALAAAHGFTSGIGTTATLNPSTKIGGIDHELAGVCFLPDTQILGTNTKGGNKFVTQGFRVALIAFKAASATDTLSGTNTDGLAIYPADAASSQLVAALTPTITNGSITESEGAFWKPGTWRDLAFNYDLTREFDYVFIDLQTYLYLSRGTAFYDTATAATLTGSEFSITRGIHVARCAYSLPVLNNDRVSYVNFRTLNMYPHPKPAATNLEASRDDLAYYLGATCPPYWKDMGVAEAAPATEGSRVMRAVAQPSPNNQQNPLDNERVHISMPDLHTALYEAGYISKEPAPQFSFLDRMRRQLIRAFIFVALLGALIAGLITWGVLKGGLGNDNFNKPNPDSIQINDNGQSNKGQRD
ncbi:MAG: hypothetical protein IT269_12095 [Saprospiraceae bacterium]|nr:hypothetical protein [Saprospiraceae bacterium]